MAREFVETLIVGCGQAGLAMSAHLSEHNLPHLILERDQIAQAWRTARWDSLVANGPAWHDRFPAKLIADVGDDEFASKHSMTRYFEEFADQISAPIRCGVEVLQVQPSAGGDGFDV